MLTQEMLVQRMVGLGERVHAVAARALIAQRLDRLQPGDTISTHNWAVADRKFIGPSGEIVDFNPNLTPYTKGISDACDMTKVRVVAVKGNTRSGKTVAAENKVLKHWARGPLFNVLWFMQDDDSIDDYIDERGEEMLRIHPDVNEKINWQDPRNGRKRKKIGRATIFYRPATMRSTRSKAAPIIVADEIDAYQVKIRDAIMGLVKNRQREFGNGALAYIASHPDAGPHGGIDTIIHDSLQHNWYSCCLNCGKSAGFASGLEHRFHWNAADLMVKHQHEERQKLFQIVQNEARLLCPHCGMAYDDAARLALSNSGTWLQPHMRLEDGEIIGDMIENDIMGFTIHAMMAPFVRLPETAKDWVAAKTTADTTGNDTPLREVTVKDLGETYEATEEEEKTEDWKIVQNRLAAPYALRTVPDGVDFLTAFVDPQGDRFEVRVIGWSISMESWLIDSFAIKQWPAFGSHGAFENIDPGNRLSDWDVIEEAVICARYPLQTNPSKFLPIAKTMVNSAGQPGVMANAHRWMANMLGRQLGQGRLIQQWQAMLFYGSVATKADPVIGIYGKSRQVEFDDKGKSLVLPIFERGLIVHEIKRLIVRRIKIAEPGPGAMHIPMKLSPRYVRELVSERLVNGKWVNIQTRNETFDAWVACDAARAIIRPERPELWANGKRPVWAAPLDVDTGIDTDTQKPLSMFDRLLELNRGAGGD